MYYAVLSVGRFRDAFIINVELLCFGGPFPAPRSDVKVSTLSLLLSFPSFAFITPSSATFVIVVETSFRVLGACILYHMSSLLRHQRQRLVINILLVVHKWNRS